jgi:hypothetical protein
VGLLHIKLCYVYYYSRNSVTANLITLRIIIVHEVMCYFPCMSLNIHHIEKLFQIKLVPGMKPVFRVL